MLKVMKVVLAIFLLIEWSVVKADQTDTLIDIVTDQMKSSGELEGVASCLGVSESKFVNAYRKSLRYCMRKHSNSEKAAEACIKNQSIINLNVSGAVVSKCQASVSDDELDDEDEYSDLTDEEFENKIAEEQALAMKTMDSIVKVSKAQSKGTEHLITLPVFNPGELVSHYQDGILNGAGKRTLPVAGFVTSESIGKVVEFYKRTLPKFAVDKSDYEIFTFIEVMPNNLLEMSMDLDNLPLGFIPHVAIYSVKLKGEMKTNITITYKK